MKSVVVDTDVISFALKGDTRFQLYAPELRDRLLIASFMTVAELKLWGLVKSWGRPRTENMIAYLKQEFATYPATTDLGDVWAELKAEARSKGRALDTADAWIAATVIYLNVPLISHNAQDFDCLSRLQLISYAPQ